MPSLRRDRLLRAMSPRSGHRLTLVTGPAGSGKTTLLAQYAAQHPGPTAWYRSEVDDAATPVLLDHLAQALATVTPGLEGGWGTVDDAVRALDQAGPAGEDGAPPALLAVDDLHVVVGTEAEGALRQLIEALPPWLRLAATCRQTPRWNLSRLRVSGALLEVDADDLRFRSWEVERLFGDVYGAPLPPGDLAHLTRGLEGWAAGLQLFHLATRGKPVSERRRAVASLPARSKLIREYLSGNVLDGLPESHTAFLLDTSVAGRLSPELCDELRGADDSRRILEDLEARQVFVTRLDGDDGYRYHEVFRSYLEGRLVERDGEAAARQRAARAAALLEADGHLADALRAWCRAADWAAAGRVLERGGAELAADPADWIDTLPRSLVDDDAWVLLAAARRAVATGRFAAALDIYARVDEAHTSVAAEATCRRERAALAAWLDPTAGSPTGWTGDLRRALRRLDDAPDAGGVRRSPAAPDAGDRLAAGLVALLAGRAGTALDVLTALVDDPEVSDVVATAARLALAVAGPLTPGGHGTLTPAELLELVERADVPWLTWMAKAAGALQAGPSGWRHARAVARTLDRQGDAWGSALARTFGALSAATTGPATPDEADEIGDLCADLRRLDAPVLEVWARAWWAAALAAVGRHDEALDHIGEVVPLARRLGVPGARVWALTIASRIADERRAAEAAAEVEAVRRLGRVDIVVTAATGATAGATAPGATDLTGGAMAASAASGPVAAPPPHPPGDGGKIAAVRVRSLGGFSLEVAGQPVELGEARPRVRSVLRYLAAQGGRPAHVETMVAALWPDVDAAAGKRNLQVAVSSLRKLLDAYRPYGAGLVRREGPSYVLALPEGSDDDLVTVTAAVEEARSRARDGDPLGAVAAGRRALAAYAGDLLPEEGPADWAVERRRSLDAEVVEVALLVAEQALAAGQPETAVAACTRGLDVDRYHDGLWRLLARAHAAAGDLAAAARTDERYRAVLDELGLATR